MLARILRKLGAEIILDAEQKMLYRTTPIPWGRIAAEAYELDWATLPETERIKWEIVAQEILAARRACEKPNSGLARIKDTASNNGGNSPSSMGKPRRSSR